MPGAVLHVVGEAFDPRLTLGSLSLRPNSEFRQGKKCFPGSPRSERRHQVGGFKCDVSSADGVLESADTTAGAFIIRAGRGPSLASVPLARSS